MGEGMNLNADSPIGKIVKEFAAWKQAEIAATSDGNEAHAVKCRTVANRLGWALSLLGVDVEEENGGSF